MRIALSRTLWMSIAVASLSACASSKTELDAAAQSPCPLRAVLLPVEVADGALTDASGHEDRYVPTVSPSALAAEFRSWVHEGVFEEVFDVRAGSAAGAEADPIEDAKRDARVRGAQVVVRVVVEKVSLTFVERRNELLSTTLWLVLPPPILNINDRAYRVAFDVATELVPVDFPRAGGKTIRTKPFVVELDLADRGGIFENLEILYTPPSRVEGPPNTVRARLTEVALAELRRQFRDDLREAGRKLVWSPYAQGSAAR